MAQNKTSGGTALAYVGGAAVAIVIVVGGIYLSGPAPVSDDVPANLPEASELPPTADVTEASPEVSAPAGISPEPEAVPDAQQPTEPSAPLVTEAPAQVETPAEPVAEAAPEGDDDGPAPLTAPTFDIVRVDPTGEALVAGKALPGAEVDVLVDNAVVDTVTASEGDGGFVSFLTLSPAGQAQVLTLVMRVEDQSVASEDQVILAPLVAQAETPSTETPQTEAPTELAQADPVAEEALNLPPVEAQDQPADTETQAAELTKALTARDEESAAPQDTTATFAPSDETETTVQAAPADLASTDSAPDEDVPAPVELAEAQPEVAQPVTEAPEAAPEPEVAPGDASAEEQIAEVVATPDPALEPAPSVPESTEASVPEPEAPEAETPEAVSVETAASDEPAEPEVSQPQPDTSSAGLAVLKAGPDGLEILRPAGPADAVVKLALDAIGYSATGDVQLAGRAGAGHRVRIYLNNHLTDVTEADETGRWAANLQDIVPGIYLLRLDEIDSGDDVLNRVETPFKREAPEVLQPLVAAQDGDAAQPPVRAVTVQEGDTLWAISRDRYGDGFLYVKVFEANRSDILDPDLIYPGQVFALPD